MWPGWAAARPRVTATSRRTAAFDRRTAGRGESRAGSSARQLVGCHVVPYLSGARGLGEQVRDQAAHLRSACTAVSPRCSCGGEVGVVVPSGFVGGCQRICGGR